MSARVHTFPPQAYSTSLRTQLRAHSWARGTHLNTTCTCFSSMSDTPGRSCGASTGAALSPTAVDVKAPATAMAAASMPRRVIAWHLSTRLPCDGVRGRRRGAQNDVAKSKKSSHRAPRCAATPTLAGQGLRHAGRVAPRPGALPPGVPRRLRPCRRCQAGPVHAGRAASGGGQPRGDGGSVAIRRVAREVRACCRSAQTGALPWCSPTLKCVRTRRSAAR